MEQICISNVKIINDCMNMEFLYLKKNDSNDINVYLENCNGKKIYGNIMSTEIVEDDNTIFTKVSFDFELEEYECLKLWIEINGKKNETVILDNKKEEILEENNRYWIFTKNYYIKIKKTDIEIKKRKKGDKLKYELFKHIYAMKNYKKIALFRLLKGTNKYYLFNDRLLYGDDNAEELFKYINENEKEFAKRCYFVLDKKSNSFDRISKIGKVLKYGTFRHKLKYINSKMIVSSHASYYDRYYNPFNEVEMKMYKDIITKRFAFVQHGVVMNDIHRFVNRCIITADLYITSTYNEYEYLKSKQYLYDGKEIIKTGLPRFDKLKNNRERIILISPTWRQSLSTRNNYEGRRQEVFKESEYYKRYSRILTDEKLKDVIKQNDYKIKFLLHPVFVGDKEVFNNLEDEYVKILCTDDIQYSKLFNECAMLITDYSSINFDVATLKKPIIYYQFDKDEFFSNHYQHGYFDYEIDGFGDVIEDENAVLEKIKQYITNDCQIEEKYKRKIEDTFMFLDNNNSKRVYEEIINLEKCNEVNYRFNNVH